VVVSAMWYICYVSPSTYTWLFLFISSADQRHWVTGDAGIFNALRAYASGSSLNS